MRKVIEGGSFSEREVRRLLTKRKFLDGQIEKAMRKRRYPWSGLVHTWRDDLWNVFWLVAALALAVYLRDFVYRAIS